MTYLYRYLPMGNSFQFPDIDALLVKRGVVAHYYDTDTGGRLYRVSPEEAKKLPYDGGPYIESGDGTGFGLYETDWEFEFPDPVWRLVE